MNNLLRTVRFLLLMATLPGFLAAQRRSDADLDAQGQVAMEQYHDCSRAKAAFEQESLAAQTSPVWLDHVARASECAGDLMSALRYYDLELQKLPDTPRLVQKVGDLRYKQQLQIEQDNAKQAAAEAALEQQRQQIARATQDLAAARARIDKSIQELAQLLEGDFKANYQFPDNSVNHHIKRHVTKADHCDLAFTEQFDKKTVDRQIALAGARAEWYENPTLDTFPPSVVFWPGGIVTINTNPSRVIELMNELGRACGP